MRHLSILAILSMALCFPAFVTPAFADGLGITLTPAIEVYPPGEDTFVCQLNGLAPCVQFSGTITDNDTDGSWVNLDGVDLLPTGDSGDFIIDNTFFNNVPGTLEGDTNNNPFAQSYTGPIFGLDFAPNIPMGIYNETLVLLADGGTGDPNNNGFAVTQSFTVVIAPEPMSAVLIGGGLLALAAMRRARRSRRTS